MYEGLDPEDRGWQDYANCLGVDPDLFFPERGASTREAKEVCRGCVVREDCLEYALANGEKFGIWGGMSERERRRIRRRRALQRRAAAPGGPGSAAPRGRRPLPETPTLLAWVILPTSAKPPPVEARPFEAGLDR